MDPAVMPDLRRQCRVSPTALAYNRGNRAPPWRCPLATPPGDAEDGAAVVADQPAREADQDRREPRWPPPPRDFPTGRGRGVAPRSRCRGGCSPRFWGRSPGRGRRPRRHDQHWARRVGKSGERHALVQANRGYKQIGDTGKSGIQANRGYRQIGRASALERLGQRPRSPLARGDGGVSPLPKPVRSAAPAAKPLVLADLTYWCIR
jgi:hypothetical protein